MELSEPYSYLLHLVNRKQIELWQKLPAEELNQKTPHRTRKNPNQSQQITIPETPSENKSHENAGVDIFITPITVIPVQ